MILVCGYHGFGNWGDEAILAALVESLESLGTARASICVLSQDPAATRQLHHVEAVGRWNPAALAAAVRRSQLLILGGGSLLQDSSSLRSIPYYLGTAELAFRLHVPVVFYANGIGPIRNRWLQRWTVRVFRRAAAYSLRDGKSAALLETLGLTVPETAVTADPVFAWSQRRPNSGGAGSHRRVGRAVLNLRPYPDWQQDVSFWLETVDRLCARVTDGVDLLAFGPQDGVVAEELRKHRPQLGFTRAESLASAVAICQQYSLAVMMRLHCLAFAALGGVCTLALDYDPKVEQLAHRLALPVFKPGDPALLRCLSQLSLEREERKHILEQLRRAAEQNRSVLEQGLAAAGQLQPA